MGEKLAHLVVAILLTAMATTLAAGASLTTAGPAAAKSKTKVSCPKKIGGFKLYRTKRSEGETSCSYGRQKWTRKDGGVYLRVVWHPDDPANRSNCDYRPPESEAASDGGVLHRIYDRDRSAYGWYVVTEGRRVTRSQAEAALHELLGAAARHAQVCLPEAEPPAQDELACPLVIGDYVRSDWYGDDTPAVEPLEGNDDGRRYRFTCRYRINVRDDRSYGTNLTLSWWEGSADHHTGRALCRMGSEDDGSMTRTVAGSHPVHGYIDNDLAAAGGQSTMERLIGVLAKRTTPCPGHEGATAAANADSSAAEPDATADTTTTTIVLSGGPGEEPPPLGATVPMPEDDQHRIVIGGLDGEVVREEFLGDQATIISFGPMATDAEGNWSVSVDVEAGSVPAPSPAPASPPPSSAPPSPRPSAAAPSVAPSSAPAASPAASPAAAPSVTPAVTPSPEPVVTPEPLASAEPRSSPTPVPPPEMVGMPEALTDYVAGLDPETAGVVRDLTDYLGWLGDDIVVKGKGEVTIPASAIAALRVLAPDLVDEIKLVSGGFIVDSYVDVRVTPVIDEDGLIEFRTNRLQGQIRANEIVKALVMALNNYVVESGGRFRTISITPEGLTVTAESRAGG